MEEVGLLHLIFDPSKRHLLPDISVCTACKQKILRRVNVFVHDGKAYHAKCAKCSKCSRNIAGPEGFVDEAGLICLKCLRDIATEPCWRCRSGIGEMMVVYGGHHYHPKCFTCTRCQSDFVKDGQYCLKDGTAYCKACYGHLFLHKCGTCHEIIQPGKLLVEIRNIRFHPDCFNCKRCKQNLMAEGYFEGNSQADGLKFYCMKCGEILNLATPKNNGKENDEEKRATPNVDNQKTQVVKDKEKDKEKEAENSRGTKTAAGGGEGGNEADGADEGGSKSEDGIRNGEDNGGDGGDNLISAESYGSGTEESANRNDNNWRRARARIGSRDERRKPPRPPPNERLHEHPRRAKRHGASSRGVDAPGGDGRKRKMGARIDVTVLVGGAVVDGAPARRQITKDDRRRRNMGGERTVGRIRSYRRMSGARGGKNLDKVSVEVGRNFSVENIGNH